MTYSSGSSGGPGYPGAQQQGSPAPTTQFSQAGDGDSKLPLYLLATVTVLGLASYLASFGTLWTFDEESAEGDSFRESVITGPFTDRAPFVLTALVLAALLAAVALIPKQRNRTGAVAVVSSLGFLLAISQLISKPVYLGAGWALITIVVLAALQAIAATGALLLDAGVITPPKPRPKYGQYPQYGGYYGSPGGQYGQQYGQQYAGPPQQSPGQPPYPPQHGPSTGGFGAAGQQAEQQSGPPTPPTGFPTYAQPPENQGGTPGEGATPEQSAPTQQMPLQKQEQQSPRPPTGPSPS